MKRAVKSFFGYAPDMPGVNADNRKHFFSLAWQNKNTLTDPEDFVTTLILAKDMYDAIDKDEDAQEALFFFFGYRLETVRTDANNRKNFFGLVWQNEDTPTDPADFITTITVAKQMYDALIDTGAEEAFKIIYGFPLRSILTDRDNLRNFFSLVWQDADTTTDPANFAVLVRRMAELKQKLERPENTLLLEMLTQGKPFQTTFADGLKDNQFLIDLVSLIGQQPDSSLQTVDQLVEMLRIAAVIRPYVQSYLDLNIDSPQPLRLEFLRENPLARETLFKVAAEFLKRGLDDKLGIGSRPLNTNTFVRAVQELRSRGYVGPLSINTLAPLLKTYGIMTDGELKQLLGIRNALSPYGIPQEGEKRYSVSLEAARVLEIILFGKEEVAKYNYRAVRVRGMFELFSPSTVRHTNPYTHQEVTETYSALGVLISRSVIDPDGSVTNENYDATGRILRARRNGVTIATYSYREGSMNELMVLFNETMTPIPDNLAADPFLLVVEQADHLTHQKKTVFMNRYGDVVAEYTYLNGRPAQAAVVKDAGIDTIRAVYLLDESHLRPFHMFTYTQRSGESLRNDPARNQWKSVHVRDEISGQESEELYDLVGRRMEVLQGNTWTTIRYNSLGMETKRLVYHSPNDARPAILRTEAGVPEYDLLGLEQLAEVEIGGRYQSYDGDVQDLKPYESDGSANIIYHDKIRHQTRLEKYSPIGRLLESVQGREKTLYDTSRLYWPIETIDLATGQIVKKFDVQPDAADPRIASERIVVYDLRRTGEKNSNWMWVEVRDRQGRLRQRTAAQKVRAPLPAGGVGELRLEETVTPTYDPRGIEADIKIVVTANGKTVETRHVNRLWWEEETGYGHAVDRNDQTGEEKATIVDENGVLLLEHTLGLPNNAVSLVERDWNGHVSGGLAYVLHKSAQIDPNDPGQAAFDNLIRLLESSSAVRTARTKKPVFSADGYSSATTVEIVFDAGGNAIGSQERTDVRNSFGRLLRVETPHRITDINPDGLYSVTRDRGTGKIIKTSQSRFNAAEGVMENEVTTWADFENRKKLSLVTERWGGPFLRETLVTEGDSRTQTEVLYDPSGRRTGTAKRVWNEKTKSFERQSEAAITGTISWFGETAVVEGVTEIDSITGETSTYERYIDALGRPLGERRGPWTTRVYYDGTSEFRKRTEWYYGDDKTPSVTFDAIDPYTSRVTTAWGETSTEHYVEGSPNGRIEWIEIDQGRYRVRNRRWAPGTNQAIESDLIETETGEVVEHYRATGRVDKQGNREVEITTADGGRRFAYYRVGDPLGRKDYEVSGDWTTQYVYADLNSRKIVEVLLLFKGQLVAKSEVGAPARMESLVGTGPEQLPDKVLQQSALAAGTFLIPSKVSFYIPGEEEPYSTVTEYRRLNDPLGTVVITKLPNDFYSVVAKWKGRIPATAYLVNKNGFTAEAYEWTGETEEANGTKLLKIRIKSLKPDGKTVLAERYRYTDINDPLNRPIKEIAQSSYRTEDGKDHPAEWVGTYSYREGTWLASANRLSFIDGETKKELSWVEITPE
ncbi:MAG: hypothetical protein HY548_03045, partial [Elusimicrobia bacterium]|nr:hypothetical protein [Elusimicrobiota bacterium]